MKRLTNQDGFSVIETVLVIVILGIIGFTGWYVWHSKQNTDKTFNAAQSFQQQAVTKKTANPSTTSNQKYVTIKEWSVVAPYPHSLSLNYKIEGNSAVFSSAQLTAADAACTDHGGQISRYAPTDIYGEGPTASATVAQAFQAQANDTQYPLVHVGNYYYAFHHDQAVCGSDPKTTTLQQQTNAVVEGMVPVLKTQ